MQKTTNNNITLFEPDACGRAYMSALGECDWNLGFQINLAYGVGFLGVVGSLLYTGGTGLVVDAVILSVAAAFIMHGHCQQLTADQYYICIGVIA